MSIVLQRNDRVIMGNELAEFDGGFVFNMDRDAMLQTLRDNESMALALLSCRGGIYYMGSGASQGDCGCRFVRGSQGEIEGSNSYGRFLMMVRDEYRRELAASAFVPEGLRGGQIVVDCEQPGEEYSDVEDAERRGFLHIHVNPHRSIVPATDRVLVKYDVNDDNPYTRVENDSVVPREVYTSIFDGSSDFQTFESPFCVSRPSVVTGRPHFVVGSAAEASFLYEKALRGELDWTALFADFKRRGILKGLTQRQEEDMVSGLNAQFDWMRSVICDENAVLRRIPIVTDSLLAVDTSFGRSMYDYDLAPSVAHVLARYINNPKLLFVPGRSCVLNALEEADKQEHTRFVSSNKSGRLTVLIDGSYTIGGVVPGTRAVRTTRDVYSNGRKTGTVTANKVQFKTQEEIELDYGSFSRRMDELFADVDPDVKVRLVTGNGYGVPQMVKRYVESRGGRSTVHDFSASFRDSSSDARFSHVSVPHIDEVFPVLAGRRREVEFNLVADDDDTAVTFKENDLKINGFVAFSASEDTHNMSVLRRASLAVAMNRPVLHVMDNSVEERQETVLASDSSVARSGLLGEMTYQESLFDSSKDRRSWSLDRCSVMSNVFSEIRVAIPFIANRYESAVYVEKVPFHSVYGAYCALVLKDVVDNPYAAVQELARSEESFSNLNAVFTSALQGREVPFTVKENAMRNAVHMMAYGSAVFSNEILRTGQSDIAVVSTVGDPELFVSLDGKGRNMTGVILSAERDVISQAIQVERQKAEEEGRILMERSRRNQKQANAARAVGEKMTGGLPGSIDESRDAVWFMGTAEPVQLALPDGRQSFELWEEGNGDAMLNRETASRKDVELVDGSRIPNRYIFLFPTTLSVVTRRTDVKNDPNIKDLTGVTRVNPDTGKEFECAFGIPVKRNGKNYEFGNQFDMPCSFRFDSENAELLSSVLSADALARSQAMKQNMVLSYAAYINRKGEERDDLSRVFSEKIWDYPRTKDEIDRRTGKLLTGGMALPVEVTRRVYNSSTRSFQDQTVQKFQKGWQDNPHAAPANYALIKRYTSTLKQGAGLPLNCIRLAKSDYTQCTEEQFLNDVRFAVQLCNALAVVQGVPMRFPLNEAGHIDFGPDVPESYCRAAERYIDSFIGVIKGKDIISDNLPSLERIPVFAALSNREKPLSRMGASIYLKPNDLVSAFGMYDFKPVLSGSPAPIHEMAFRMEDGTIIKVTDPRLVNAAHGSLTRGDINKYVTCQKNDSCRFVIRSSDEERIPAFTVQLLSYIARAKMIEVESRIVGPNELDSPESLEGYVNVFPSNSTAAATDEHDVVARPKEDAIEVDNRFDVETDRERTQRPGDPEYYGKEEAKDGFQGYAQYRYSFPDGTQSGWITVKDLDLAKDIILTKLHRDYRMDSKVLPTEQVLTCILKGMAVRHAGDRFLTAKMPVAGIVEDDHVVRSERKISSSAPSASAGVAPKEKPVQSRQEPAREKFNIYAGTKENARFSNFAERPFTFKFKSFMSR